MGYRISKDIQLRPNTIEELRICHRYLTAEVIYRSIMLLGPVDDIPLKRCNVVLRSDEELVMFKNNIMSINHSNLVQFTILDLDYYDRLDILYELGIRPIAIHDWIRLLTYDNDYIVDKITSSNILVDSTFYRNGLIRLWKLCSTNGIVVNHYMRYYNYIIPILYPRLDDKFSKFISYTYPSISVNNRLHDVNIMVD